MALSVAELRIGVKATKAFIAADAEEVVFIPRIKGSDGAGGATVTDGTPRDPQTVRLIPFFQTPENVMAGEASVGILNYYVLGLPESTFQDGDKFVYKGLTYRVGSLMPDMPEYQRKAAVNRLV